ncbi:hypothetical protein [Flavobacterium sp. FlaQc-47]|uniref:hypothetical protein n=1 Tax=Flavobacterium sp. FlaQc-47 TaxID=3374180 RepID=UPI00375817A1
MLRIRKIQEDDGNGEYSIFESADVEFADPIDFFATSFIGSSFSMMKDIVLAKKPPFPFPLEQIEKTLMKEAVRKWEENFKESLQLKIPENFLSLLTSTTKKEQIKLLKNQTLTPEQTLALLLRAKIDFGYTFSQYKCEHYPKGLDESKLPTTVEIKGDKVHKIGPTTLSDGQLRQAIDQRKVIVSKFLDKGSQWHCFFLTYDSIKWKESWKDGQPHYHYISDKFGIPRDQVVSQLKSSHYKLGSLPHIDLLDYRDKPN